MESKVLVIVGPTASGKSSLGVRLAKKFRGEVISADSRQVYRGLDIGTGKVTKKEMQGIHHHLLSVAPVMKQFTASDYKKLATEALRVVTQRHKLPIIVGGTGFYIDMITKNISLPDVPPNKSLRKKLSNKSAEELFKLIKTRDPKRAQTIDRNNKVRLIRALEIIESLGKVPEIKSNSDDNFIYIGLKPNNLDKLIYSRLIKRIPGILKETKKISPKRAHELGLEYRFAARYLERKIDKKDREIKHSYSPVRQASDDLVQTK